MHQPLRTLEFAPPCKQLAIIQIIVYVLSFSLTWYKVWWDSIIGLVVAFIGYWGFRDPITNPTQRSVRNFYYGSIASELSHAIALSVVLYYKLNAFLANDVIGLRVAHVHDVPGWTFVGFLITFLVVELTLTAGAIFRSNQLLAELARNSMA
ncbi:hypothetical protein Poli38472_001576 [Pythium oligandrum]|uniref:Uncharacterized protein n=1 Tax=Pythium oligandrum TaxID=41045 RepID=A0A8K1FMJ0_PYTOL|nr:hypothetical protein Poli38472_001576 [Pythium oligandrum]|eukprot:TMW69420.1 hypothetical protein Poli38472_001576 [Pythium oligandrum]